MAACRRNLKVGLEGESATTARSALALVEVLRRYVVEELAELLDLVLLLVGYDDPGVVEQVLGAHDLRTGAQREGDRVGGARADLDTGGQDQRRVEDVVAHLGDPD